MKKKKLDNERLGIRSKTSQMDVSENMLMKKRCMVATSTCLLFPHAFHSLFKIVFFNLVTVRTFCLNSLLLFSVFICKSLCFSTVKYTTPCTR